MHTYVDIVVCEYACTYVCTLREILTNVNKNHDEKYGLHAYIHD